MFKYIAFIAIALCLLPIEIKIQEVEANVATFKPENNLKQHLENPVPLAVKKNYHSVATDRLWEELLTKFPLSSRFLNYS